MFIDIECGDAWTGADYKGRVNETESGRVCQTWTDQSPHQHHMQPVDETGFVFIGVNLQ